MKWMGRILFFVLALLTLHGPIYSFETLPKGIIRYRNIEPGSSKPKIALVTFISEPKYSHVSETYVPYPEVVRFGTRSKILYCQKHGYDYIIGSQKMTKCLGMSAPNKEKLSIHWMKVPMIGNFLGEYDWVIWTDADSIILNPDITLESLINDKYDVIFGTFGMGQGARGTGHIYVKNSEWSRQFLKEWWSYSEQIHEGQWDLERLNDMLNTKGHSAYFDHFGYLPVKLSDLAAEEFVVGDFMVHFYSYHGKHLYQIFKVFEEKYSYIIDKLENELLENDLLKGRYTDHLEIFKEIFASSAIRGVLELGMGTSTRFFLNNCPKVISVDFVNRALGPDWLNYCLKIFKYRTNWYPIAFLSGCTLTTYPIEPYPRLQFIQGSTRVRDAHLLALRVPNRALMTDKTYYTDLDGFARRVTRQNSIDLGFVISGLFLRGELVQSLFDKVPIIVVHDFPKDISKVDPSSDRYGYTFISAPSHYEAIYFGPPVCQEGLKVWINKNDSRFTDTIKRLKSLACY